MKGYSSKSPSSILKMYKEAWTFLGKLLHIKRCHKKDMFPVHISARKSRKRLRVCSCDGRHSKWPFEKTMHSEKINLIFLMRVDSNVPHHNTRDAIFIWRSTHWIINAPAEKYRPSKGIYDWEEARRSSQSSSLFRYVRAVYTHLKDDMIHMWSSVHA